MVATQVTVVLNPAAEDVAEGSVLKVERGLYKGREEIVLKENNAAGCTPSPRLEHYLTTAMGSETGPILQVPEMC